MAETESFDASSGAFQLGIPMARALVLCFVISIAMAGLGGYLLGYSEVFGSRHTTVDRLRHEFVALTNSQLRYGLRLSHVMISVWNSNL